MDSENKPTSQGSSVGSLLSTVMHEISSLVRNEAELAKTEISEKTHQPWRALLQSPLPVRCCSAVF